MSRTIIKKGETFRKVIRMKYADTGIPVDLSECTAFSQMRTAPGGVLIDTGACTIEADTGSIYVLFNAERTNEMNEGHYGYDVWLVKGSERKPIYTELVDIVDRYTDNMPAINSESEPEPEPSTDPEEPENEGTDENEGNGE